VAVPNRNVLAYTESIRWNREEVHRDDGLVMVTDRGEHFGERQEKTSGEPTGLVSQTHAFWTRLI